MSNERKKQLEKIIFSAFMLVAALLFYLGFDEAAMAIVGIFMIVYGVKDLITRKWGGAATLLAVGLLILCVAVYLRLR